MYLILIPLYWHAENTLGSLQIIVKAEQIVGIVKTTMNFKIIVMSYGFYSLPGLPSSSLMKNKLDQEKDQLFALATQVKYER